VLDDMPGRCDDGQRRQGTEKAFEEH
jgi:hypothetical protein